MGVLKALRFLTLLSCALALPALDKIIPKYRLPAAVTPSKYTVNINLERDSFQTKSFLGNVAIAIKVTKKTKEIVLHASRINVFHIQLTKGKSTLPYANFDVDDDTEFLTISFEEDLDVGDDYQLSLAYIGTLGDDDMYGFYQSVYKDDAGDEHHLATTQFESTYARRAFPCFDEPRLKATFVLTITYPGEYTAISNTNMDTETKNGDMTTRTFKETPIMSTYLVAFIVSDFVPTLSTDDKTFSVWARPGTENNRNVALDQGPKLLQKLGEFTGIDYKTHGLGKMDVAAIPDFAAGAMENWGLVTYREVALVDDGDDTSNYMKQKITTTVAHEFAHSWFGDLVTLGWWSDTWLNEGFATYFEYNIAHEVDPSYELDKQFVLAVQQQIFQTDALISALPLSSKESDIGTPTEIDNKFSILSYNKGGSVIRMMSHFLGAKFQAGLKKYLGDHKNSNTQPKDLWDAFDSTTPNLPDDKTMSDVMDTWVNKAGFPFVTVTLTNGKVAITQARFLYGNQKDETKWYVPISYTKGSDKDKFSDTTAKHWLEPAKDLIFEETLGKDEWLIVNNQASGYYRVNYGSGLWKRITTSLRKEDFDGISNELNRAQLVDNIFTLARIDQATYAEAFALAEYLTDEVNYYPWTSAFNSFSFLIQRTGASALGKAISGKLLKLMDKLYKSVPIKQLKPKDHIYTLNQAQALKWACDLGNEDCIKETKAQFNTYKTKGTKPDTNLRSVVYCTALRNSDKSQDDWDFLWGKFGETASSAEQNLLLTALGCTKDTKMLENYLMKSITEDSGIRKQDGVTAFKAVYSGNPEGVDIAYNFLKDNHVAIAKYYKGMGSLSTLLSGIADRFTTQEQVDDLKEFVSTQDLSEDFKIVGEQSIESATSNIKWVTSFEKQLNSIFGIKTDDGNDGDGGAGSIQTGLVLLITLVLSFHHLT